MVLVQQVFKIYQLIAGIVCILVPGLIVAIIVDENGHHARAWMILLAAIVFSLLVWFFGVKAISG